MRLMKLIAVLCFGILVTACAKDISPDVYSEAEVGQASATREGIIVAARNVIVQEGKELENNVVGGAVGGILGGVAGNQVGKGGGKDIITAAGAAAGAAIGALAEKEVKKQGGIEYTVRMSTGNLITVVQGREPILAINQKVFVIQGKTTRLVPNDTDAVDLENY